MLHMKTCCILLNAVLHLATLLPPLEHTFTHGNTVASSKTHCYTWQHVPGNSFIICLFDSLAHFKTHIFYWNSESVSQLTKEPVLIALVARTNLELSKAFSHTRKAGEENADSAWYGAVRVDWGCWGLHGWRHVALEVMLGEHHSCLLGKHTLLLAGRTCTLACWEKKNSCLLGEHALCELTCLVPGLVTRFAAWLLSRATLMAECSFLNLALFINITCITWIKANSQTTRATTKAYQKP